MELCLERLYMKTINTSECEECINCTLDDGNKARVKVFCSTKNKTYYYGQTVPCENKEIKPVENKN